MDAGMIGIGVTVCVTTISGIVWALRLEGRVNSHDKLFEENDKLYALSTKHADERHDDIKDRLIRIENKLDNANVKDATRLMKP